MKFLRYGNYKLHTMLMIVLIWLQLQQHYLPGSRMPMNLYFPIVQVCPCGPMMIHDSLRVSSIHKPWKRMDLLLRNLHSPSKMPISFCNSTGLSTTYFCCSSASMVVPY